MKHFISITREDGTTIANEQEISSEAVILILASLVGNPAPKKEKKVSAERVSKKKRPVWSVKHRCCNSKQMRHRQNCPTLSPTFVSAPETLEDRREPVVL